MRRLAGATRYATAALVRDEAVAVGMDPDRIWLATGRSFTDALTPAPTVAALGETFNAGRMGLPGAPAVPGRPVRLGLHQGPPC